MDKERGPEILIIPMGPGPGPVARAAMVSMSENMALAYEQKE
jgi:hypothetical protein